MLLLSYKWQKNKNNHENTKSEKHESFHGLFRTFVIIDLFLFRFLRVGKATGYPLMAALQTQAKRGRSSPPFG
ncbi:MAG: hypothetical protein DRH90_10225 [Deltaproteobacteria bacterium]|nr:MAG: hypothetical protein DRH90_10225 [Deltaproteobacteria bacterium]RLC18292.1 MAG: hypothetical protein DRI24_03540 [Deltaproteobacteria bacterium]